MPLMMVVLLSAAARRLSASHHLPLALPLSPLPPQAAPPSCPCMTPGCVAFCSRPAPISLSPLTPCPSLEPSPPAGGAPLVPPHDAGLCCCLQPPGAYQPLTTYPLPFP